MKVLLLINPASRGGRGIRLKGAFLRELDKGKILHEERLLSSIEEAFEYARTTGSSAYDALVPMGGDGTVSAVGSGLLANADPDMKMGVLYSGTSPDFCRFYHIPTDPVGAAELLHSGQCRKISVLTANGTPFFCSCNPGMGAEIAAKANRWRPLLGDGPGTLAALLGVLLKNPRYTFTVNGKTLEKCSHLLVTRMPYIAGGLKLVTPPVRDDEYFLWHLQDMNAVKWLKVLFSLYTARPCGTLEKYSSPIRISSDPPCLLEYDGDPRDTLPVEIKFHPRKLNLIAPQPEGVENE